MDWWIILLIIFGGVLLLLATGLPVAFCFLLINLLCVFFLQGGGRAFHQLILSIYSSLTTFTLLPIPLFVLMGELLWHSGVAYRAIDVLDKWLGRLPGRLSILTILAGTVFSTLSGSTMANTAMLGTMLVPDMERRGYKKPMTLGPTVASGGLAMMIPPSALAVILAAIAKLSIGKILIGGIIPGLIMAALYTTYVVGRCIFQPDLAPSYEVIHRTWSEKFEAFVRYLLPLGSIIFLVIGLIILGVATPTEAAALGCLGSFVICAVYRGLSWQILKKSIGGTVNITVMSLMIISGAIAFSQMLAYSGASRSLLEFVVRLPLPPITLLIIMQVILLFLGTVMEQIAIMMITLPIYMPIVKTLGFDPIWFGILMLINLEMALTTPPFGLLLFVMKGVASTETTMGDIYKAGLPFLICDAMAMALLLIFPSLATWLPSIVR